MKVSDSDTIKTSEKDLIDAIAGELDWEAIENLFKEKHNLTLEDELEYKDGDIIIHNNQIAYKLNFDIKIKLSVLFDRKGECLDVSTNEKKENNDLSEEVNDGENLQPANSDPPDQVGEAESMEINKMADEDEDEFISEIANEVAVMIPEEKINPAENGFDQNETEGDSQEEK